MAGTYVAANVTPMGHAVTTLKLWAYPSFPSPYIRLLGAALHT